MITWTELATRQLDHARDYIALSSSQAVADRIITRIVNTVGRVIEFPLSGRRGRISGTRELVIPNTLFIVAYRVRVGSILILAVYHAAQHWPQSL